MKWHNPFFVVVLALSIAHGQERAKYVTPDTIVRPERLDLDEADPHPAFRPGDADALRQIEYLQVHPFNLNTVSFEELQSIPAISDDDARAVIDHRRRIRRFTSVTQLAQIPGPGMQIFHRLAPFVVAMPDPVVRGPVVETRTRITTAGRSDRREAQYAFRQNLSARISENTSLGILFDKTEGQRMALGNATGFLELTGLPWSAHIILGDYVVCGGQGLVFWRNRYSSKEGPPSALQKHSQGDILPSRSVSDASLRGAAATISIPSRAPIALSLVVSRRDLMARIAAFDESDGLSSDEVRAAAAALTPGARLVERLFGARLSWSPDECLMAGLSCYRSAFEEPTLEPTVAEHLRSGASVGGIDFNVNAGRAKLLGEMALSDRNATAILLGCVIDASRAGSISAAWRKYSPGFFNPHAGGFGENGLTRNETGFYVSCDLQLGHAARFTGYLDQFSYPDGTGDEVLPQGGKDLSGRLTIEESERVRVSLKLTREIRDETITSSAAPGRLLPSIAVRSSLRGSVTVAIRVSSHLLLTTRVDDLQTERSGVTGVGKGQLLTQQVSWHGNTALEVSAKIVMFGIDGKSPSLYVTESDLPGSFSHTVFTGFGTRWFLTAQWHPAIWISANLRWSLKESRQLKAGASPGTRETIMSNGFGMQLDCRL